MHCESFRMMNERFEWQILSTEGDSEAGDNSLCALCANIPHGRRKELKKGEWSKVIEAKTDTHTLLESRTQVNYPAKVTNTIVRHNNYQL